MAVRSPRSRRLTALASGAALAASGMAAMAAPAHASGHLECGDVIVEDTVLTADLICDGLGDALVIGADDIVLDLGGYTITGPGATAPPPADGSGVRIPPGYSGVTVQKGTIAGFRAGVVIDSSSDNTVTKIHAIANERGVNLANAARSIVTQNTVESSTGDGVAVGGAGSSGSVVSQNHVVGNVWGLTVNDADDVTVSRNTIESNRFGIAVFGGATGTVVTQNTVLYSDSHGIETTVASGFLVSQNTSSFNGGYGFHLLGSGTAARNKAEGNGLGGFFFGPSVIDGGGNKTL